MKLTRTERKNLINQILTDYYYDKIRIDYKNGMITGIRNGNRVFIQWL